MPTRSSSRLSRNLFGSLAGIVAAAIGLAVAEVVATFASSFQSPVLDVADRVIDGVPRPVKEFAIDQFGTNDKVALLVGIASILAVYAAVLGILALSRRWPLSLLGIALFGVAGAYASQSTPRQAPFAAVLPSIAGAAAAGVALYVLHRIAVRPAAEPSSAEPVPVTSTASIAQLVPSDRRRFLAAVGIGAAGAVVLGSVGRTIKRGAGAAASRAKVVLATARNPLAPAPAAVAVDVDGVSPFFTPNRDFYRIDTAVSVPQVPIDDWALRVTGLVAAPLELSFADLTGRELVEADITLSCVSNEVGGKLLGTARWLGVRLDDLLAEAGIDPSADQIVGRSVDGYTCGFPVAALDGRDALVAVAMNGEPLPLEHGFPARLIVAGLYGYVSATKWLQEIELTRFDAFDQYWVERGWVDDAPIKVQSRIDTPKGLASVAAGTVAVAGVAWAQTRGIGAVEVQIDDGEWTAATLADELNEVTWRQWSFAWEAAPGRHTITVRATEKNGPIQTEDRTEPFPSGATGRHQIVVIAS